MSEIFLEENAIILAAAEKMVDLGQEAAERVVNGKEAKTQDATGLKILNLLTAYRQKINLTDKELEAILYDLKYISEESIFPTIDPIVGQALEYSIQINGPTPGAWVNQGNYDASGDAFPEDGVTTTRIKDGYTWDVTVAGTLGGVSVEPGATIRARVDNPGQNIVNWSITY